MSLLSSRNLFKLGSDPEVFLINSKGDLISAIDKFPGSKVSPHALDIGFKEAFVQVDNVLVEYNTPPTADLGLWCIYHEKILEWIKAKANSLGLKVAIKASGELADAELADPLARAFGCEPDFNAWTHEVNPAPHSHNKNLRSAGGHIHIGGSFTDIEKVNMARHMDCLLGAIATLYDPDTRRKELYGRPGAMRFKPYGFEYRTVSNFWLSSKRLQQAAYRCASYVASIHGAVAFEKLRPSVMKMFATNDAKIAEEIWKEAGGGPSVLGTGVDLHNVEIVSPQEKVAFKIPKPVYHYTDVLSDSVQFYSGTGD